MDRVSENSILSAENVNKSQVELGFSSFIFKFLANLMIYESGVHTQRLNEQTH